MNYSQRLWQKVRLKSGGPEMTTTSHHIDLSTNEEAVICKWHDEKSELNMATFDMETLDVIDT
jgi:uncharacterized protein YodC (DUF2158 family)